MLPRESVLRAFATLYVFRFSGFGSFEWLLSKGGRVMVGAVVKQVDPKAGSLVVETEDGKEFTLNVDEHTEITVMELETAGDEDGTLEDIGVGYLVSVEFTEGDDGCACHTLESIS